MPISNELKSHAEFFRDLKPAEDSVKKINGALVRDQKLSRPRKFFRWTIHILTFTLVPLNPELDRIANEFFKKANGYRQFDNRDLTLVNKAVCNLTDILNANCGGRKIRKEFNELKNNIVSRIEELAKLKTTSNTAVPTITPVPTITTIPTLNSINTPTSYSNTANSSPLNQSYYRTPKILTFQPKFSKEVLKERLVDIQETELFEILDTAGALLHELEEHEQIKIINMTLESYLVDQKNSDEYCSLLEAIKQLHPKTLAKAYEKNSTTSPKINFSNLVPLHYAKMIEENIKFIQDFIADLSDKTIGPDNKALFIEKLENLNYSFLKEPKLADAIFDSLDISKDSTRAFFHFLTNETPIENNIFLIKKFLKHNIFSNLDSFKIKDHLHKYLHLISNFPNKNFNEYFQEIIPPVDKPQFVEVLVKYFTSNPWDIFKLNVTNRAYLDKNATSNHRCKSHHFKINDQNKKEIEATQLALDNLTNAMIQQCSTASASPLNNAHDLKRLRTSSFQKFFLEGFRKHIEPKQFPYLNKGQLFAALLDNESHQHISRALQARLKSNQKDVFALTLIAFAEKLSNTKNLSTIEKDNLKKIIGLKPKISSPAIVK